MDQKEILGALPHRYPFIMVDKILTIEYNKKVIGIKNVSANEPWAGGHFPNGPIFPGVLMIETMAQIGGFAFYNGKELRSYLCGVDKVKFIKKVFPGDGIEITGEVVVKATNMARVRCTAVVNNEVVAKGLISYAFF